MEKKKEFRKVLKVSLMQRGNEGMWEGGSINKKREAKKSIRPRTTHFYENRQLIFQIDIHEILLSCHF